MLNIKVYQCDLYAIDPLYINISQSQHNNGLSTAATLTTDKLRISKFSCGLDRVRIHHSGKRLFRLFSVSKNKLPFYSSMSSLVDARPTFLSVNSIQPTFFLISASSVLSLSSYHAFVHASALRYSSFPQHVANGANFCWQINAIMNPKFLLKQNWLLLIIISDCPGWQANWLLLVFHLRLSWLTWLEHIFDINVQNCCSSV